MKSYFKQDLEKERLLAMYLDGCYRQALKHYECKRVNDSKNQMQGVDLYFEHRTTGATYAIDEKAQLDYINDDLPTFSFELSYYKNDNLRKGWLFDRNKKTDFYSLITAIYQDEPDTFTSCKITLVNRKLLVNLLIKKGFDSEYVATLRTQKLTHGKHLVAMLDAQTEGYLFASFNNKVERPVNLILRLEWLLANGVAKRLI